LTVSINLFSRVDIGILTHSENICQHFFQKKIKFFKKFFVFFLNRPTYHRVFAKMGKKRPIFLKKNFKKFLNFSKNDKNFSSFQKFF